MNKTLRNRALKDINKLITCDMNGEDWYAPDGYFATAYPIYEGYKIKQSQRIPYISHKPLLHKILPSDKYILADTTEVDTVTFGYDTIKISSNTTGTSYYVNKNYWNLLINIYQKALPFVISNGDKLAPIELKDNDVLIAVIMPLKNKKG